MDITASVSKGKRGLTLVDFLESDAYARGQKSVHFYNPINAGDFPDIKVGEEYRLRVLGKERLSKNKKTRDGRVIFFSKVKILHRIEKPCGGWFEEEAGVFHERYISGEVRGERLIPAQRREFYAWDRERERVVRLMQTFSLENNQPLGVPEEAGSMEKDEFLETKRKLFHGIRDAARAANEFLRNLPKYNRKTGSLAM